MARPVTDKRLQKLAKSLAGTKQVQRAAGRSRMSGGPGKNKPKNLLAVPLPGEMPRFWSFTRWVAWRDCPRYYLLDKVKKLVPFEGNAATERGTMIHMKGKQFLLGNTKGVPTEFDHFAKEMKNLKRHGAIPEQDWVITKDEKKTRGDDFVNAWLRAAIDAYVAPGEDGVLYIVDYKTGQLKVDKQQGELYAALSTLFYPDAKKIVVELWFVDQDHVEPFEYTAKEARALWKKWRERADRMLGDREFKPKPGSKCKFCPYRSDKEIKGMPGVQGPCDKYKEAA